MKNIITYINESNNKKLESIINSFNETNPKYKTFYYAKRKSDGKIIDFYVDRGWGAFQWKFNSQNALINKIKESIKKRYKHDNIEVPMFSNDDILELIDICEYKEFTK